MKTYTIEKQSISDGVSFESLTEIVGDTLIIAIPPDDASAEEPWKFENVDVLKGGNDNPLFKQRERARILRNP